MDDQITWSLCGATVVAADDAARFMPHGDHSLLIKKALILLSDNTDFTTTGKVTVHNLPWPIKAIVEPNNGRVPVWATHSQHQVGQVVNSDGLSPFICADRDLRPPMTKSLTFDIAGTIHSPIVANVYPGSVLPPLPWQVDVATDVAAYEMSVAFWRTHSFIFDKATALHQQDAAPSWYAGVPSPFTLLLR